MSPEHDQPAKPPKKIVRRSTQPRGPRRTELDWNALRDVQVEALRLRRYKIGTSRPRVKYDKSSVVLVNSLLAIARAGHLYAGIPHRPHSALWRAVATARRRMLSKFAAAVLDKDRAAEVLAIKQNVG